jgi:hypothetical protein
MGGGEQQSPAMQQLLAEQQRKELAKAFQSSMQGIGAAVAQPSGAPALGGQRPSAPAGVYGATPGPIETGAATGPLFRPQGGIGEQDLAQILRQLGYG